MNGRCDNGIPFIRWANKGGREFIVRDFRDSSRTRSLVLALAGWYSQSGLNDFCYTYHFGM